MRKEVSLPAAVAVIIVIVIVIGGFGWYMINRQSFRETASLRQTPGSAGQKPQASQRGVDVP